MISAPADRSSHGNTGLLLDRPDELDLIVVSGGPAVGAVPPLDLEKRRSRGGRSRSSSRPKKTRTRRPKKTRPKKKTSTKKKTTKKKTTKKTKKPAKKRPTKKKPTKTKTKKPAKPVKKKKSQCKQAKPCKGKNCKRVEPSSAGASCPLNKQKETTNYKVALAAAKRAGVRHLSIGQSYLLVHRDSRTPVTHKTLVLGKVKKNLEGQLDFEATGIDLQWDTDAENPIAVRCKQLYGAECIHHEIETYQCERSIAKHKHGSYKFAGTAKPEFADPDTFKSTGKSHAS